MNRQRLEQVIPKWFLELLKIRNKDIELGRLTLSGREFSVKGGIIRDPSLTSERQQQTSDAFGFKWKKRSSYETTERLNHSRAWLNHRYGHPLEAGWVNTINDTPIVLDAGCGAAASGLEYWGPILGKIKYIGVDISSAVEVAKERCLEKKISAGFMQSNLMGLPLPKESVDVIFSEGVLHHTDSTEKAFKSLCPILKKGGLFMFYIYRKKSPVREFTDDYVRAKMQNLEPEVGWEAMKSLSKLGQALGEIDAEVEIPEAVDLLGIPEGRVSVQRLFYWHFCKAFYHPEISLEEMNHINFDWYAPANAHRHTIEDAQQWCESAGLNIERERVEEAGITIVARKC